MDAPGAKKFKLSSDMEYVTIPGTDLRVSRICMGTMQFSGSVDEGTVDVTWGSMSQESVNETVKAALDSGINFFDCAEAYGKDNCAERAFGIALKGRREEVVLTSKFGKHLPLWECDGLAEEQIYRYYSRTDILAALDRSLEALQTDYLDLYQIHWPTNVGLLTDTQKPQQEVVEALEEAKKTGKIRHYGVCNFGTQDLDCLLGAGANVVTNQIPYNLLWRGIESTISPKCVDRGIGLLCYSPLQQGLLAGKFAKAEDIPEGRRRTRLFACDSAEKSRHGWDGATKVEETLFKAGGVLDQLRHISKDAGLSLVEVATAWLLAQPGVVSVIVGASSKEQVHRNAKLPKVAAATLELCSEATEELKGLLSGYVDQYAAVQRTHGV